MATEDERNAVNIHAGIGSQVLAASFVLLGILLGYFDIRNIELLSTRGILLLIAITALIASIIIASYGLKKLRDNGNGGDWDYSKTHINFRLQTWLTYLALMLFIIVFLVKPGKSPQEREMIQTNLKLERLIRIDSLELQQLIQENNKLKAATPDTIHPPQKQKETRR